MTYIEKNKELISQLPSEITLTSLTKEVYFKSHEVIKQHDALVYEALNNTLETLGYKISEPICYCDPFDENYIGCRCESDSEWPSLEMSIDNPLHKWNDDSIQSFIYDNYTQVGTAFTNKDFLMNIFKDRTIKANSNLFVLLKDINKIELNYRFKDGMSETDILQVLGRGATKSYGVIFWNVDDNSHDYFFRCEGYLNYNLKNQKISIKDINKNIWKLLSLGSLGINEYPEDLLKSSSLNDLYSAIVYIDEIFKLVDKGILVEKEYN